MSSYEVQFAKPGDRRKTVIVLGAGLLVGVALILAAQKYQPLLESWILSDPSASGERLTFVLRVFAVVMPLPLIGMSVYLWRMGTKTVAAARFPAPGTRLIRARRVLVGSKAIAVGRVHRMLALTLAGASVALGGIFLFMAMVVP